MKKKIVLCLSLSLFFVFNTVSADCQESCSPVDGTLVCTYIPSGCNETSNTLGGNTESLHTGVVSNRSGYGRSPQEILLTVVGEANKDYKIQDTALDGITSQDTSFTADKNFTLTNTLVNLKNTIHPYLQWAVYLGLSLAVILLIYNGFLMVTNVMHGNGEFSKLKNNFIYIALGVIVLTGFYYLIDIIVAVINMLLG